VNRKHLKTVDAATPEQRAMKARINEAHTLMADTRKKAAALVVACDLMLDVLIRPVVNPYEAQKNFDHATRKFYRATIDVNTAAEFYAQRFITVEKRSVKNRWANFTARVKGWFSRQVHKVNAWRDRRRARRGK